MSVVARPRSWRLAGAVALAGVVSTSLVAVGTLGPASATPTGDCAEPFPVSELAEGQPVTGLTVSKGTTPAGFSGEVLGVVENGIAAGLDMIMVELSSPAIDKAGGIWAGMSGSPVYAADDRLIGAVAYGLTWGSTPIAGVTPFEAMGSLRDAPAVTGSVRVEEAHVRAIARTGAATMRQAQQGFRHLPVPLGLSGVDSSRLDKPTGRSYLAKPSYLSGVSAAGSGASADTLVAGGNLAAVASKGDVTMSGVGTVTSVCDERLVGFGHPMRFGGEASFGLGAASAVLVQPDPLGVPFKVANLGDLAGTITDDRLAGIAGVLGPVPPAAPFTSDLSFGTRNRAGRTDVFAPDAMPSAAFFGSVANHDRVLDAIMGGTETQSWVIEGTRPDGSEFTLPYVERIHSRHDIAFDASYDLAEVLWALGNIPGVTISSVSSTVDVARERGIYRMTKVQQRVGDRWVSVGYRNPAQVRAGRTLRLRVTLASEDATVTKGLSLRVPNRLRGRTGYIEVVGGNRHWTPWWRIRTFKEFRRALQTQPRNDQVLAEVSIGRGSARLSRSLRTTPARLVVNGQRFIAVVVR